MYMEKEKVQLIKGSKVTVDFTGNLEPFWYNEKAYGYDVSDGGISKVMFVGKRLNEQLKEWFDKGITKLEIETGEWQGYTAYKVNSAK